MVHTSYVRCQNILKDHLASGNSLQDFTFLTRRHISVENLKSRNVVPLVSVTLAKYCELLNLAYRQGQNYLFNDIRNKQIQTDAQLAYLLASDEIEMLQGQTKADEDLAKKLDKSWNSTMGNGDVICGQGGGTQQTERKKKPTIDDMSPNATKSHANKTVKVPEEIFESKLAEVKRDVLKEAHELLESIFNKTFDSKCTNAAKVLRTHEVYIAVNALRDFGSILASKNLCIALVNSETGEFYAGFDTKDKTSHDKQDAAGREESGTLVLKSEISGNPVATSDIDNQTVPGLGVQYVGTSTYPQAVRRQQYEQFGRPAFPNIPPVTRVTTLQHSLATSSHRQDSLNTQSHLNKPSQPPSASNLLLDVQAVRSGSTSYESAGLCGQYQEPVRAGSVLYSGRGGSGTYSEFSENASAPNQTPIFQQNISSEQVNYIDKTSCVGESGIVDKQGRQAVPSSTKSSVGGSDDESGDPYQSEYLPQEFSLAVKSPSGKRKNIKQIGGCQKKMMTGHEIPPESMQAMAESKSLQITSAIEALRVKRTNDNFQNLYPNIESLNRKPSRGRTTHTAFIKLLLNTFTSWHLWRIRWYLIF